MSFRDDVEDRSDHPPWLRSITVRGPNGLICVFALQAPDPQENPIPDVVDVPAGPSVELDL